MKEFSSTQYFDYPWDYVSAANWRKYPNKNSTHVVAVDVLRREFDPISQILKSERLITCKQPIPSWLKIFVNGAEISYVREISIVDNLNKILTMRSVNLTFSNLLKVYETVIYEQNPLDPLNKTLFKQNAQFTSKTGWSNLQNKIESWGVERFSQNALKGKLGFDSILQLGIIDNLSNSANQLIDEINFKTTCLLNDFNLNSDLFLNEIDENSKKLLNEIKNCNYFKDLNNLSLDILKDLNVKSEILINDLSIKKNSVINDVNKISNSLINNDIFLNHINNKTDQILNEFDTKKLQISNQISKETQLIFDALNIKTQEILHSLESNSNSVNDIDSKYQSQSQSESSLKSKITNALFKLTHPFSKS
jgi:hypothetical protein